MALRIHAQMTSSPVGTDILFFHCPYEEFVSSKLFVANSGGAATFTISLVPADVDEIIGVNHNLFGGHAIAANTTIVVPPGITMQRGDTMFINGSSVDLTFTLFGEGIGEEG